jgi:protein TonB
VAHVEPAPAPVVPPSAIEPEIDAPGATLGSVPAAVTAIEAGAGTVTGVGLAAAVPPTLSPATPIRLHRGIRAPEKIVHVAPRYPFVARASHTEGTVVLEAVIDVTGLVTSARVLRSVPLLDDAALEAVRAWRFTPALLNDQPVPVVMTITVTFTLSR